MKLRYNQWRNARRQAMIIGLALPGMVSNAFSQWMDGDDLQRVCNAREVEHVFKPGVCSGYLMASIDLAEGLNEQSLLKAPLFCMPADVSMPQLGDIVTKYIEGHPARKDINASTLVMDALHEKYPCK
jgi:hypothetical protein